MVETISQTAPSPFSQTLPTFQTAWDSTSLGWLKTCPRLYKFQMLDGWTTRTRGIHLAFGGYYAAALERYHHAIADGLDHDAATLIMVRWALENSGTYTYNLPDYLGGGPAPVRFHYIDDTKIWEFLDPSLNEEIGEIASSEVTFHPWDPSPHPDANIKNRYTLIRSLVWNVEDLKTSVWSTVRLANGRPAVELSFNFHAFDIDDEPISLSGHFDRVVSAEGQFWIQDDKTTKSGLDANYFSQYSPNNQMSLYSLAGRVVLSLPIRGVLVRATQILVSGNRFATHQVQRPQAVIDEWFADTQTYIRQAKSYALNNHWPANDKNCFLCAFKKVCAVSPAHRSQWLAADFVQAPRWNPLQARGDI